ncbi:MAG: 4Fe-4S double cluster binding domain-containing protein [Spirochaetota bacterium]
MHLSSIEDYIRDAALGSGFSRVRFLSPYEPERIFGLKMERDNHWEGAPSLMVVALPYGNRGIAAPENQQQAQPGLQPEAQPIAQSKTQQQAQPIAQSKTEPEARSDGHPAGIAPFARRNYYAEAVIRLQALVKVFRERFGGKRSDYRILCNSPVPEKPLAMLCGLGWLGKNSLIITPEAGSLIIIAAMTLPFPVQSDVPLPGILPAEHSAATEVAMQELIPAGPECTAESTRLGISFPIDFERLAFPACKICGDNPACVNACPAGALAGDGLLKKERCIQWYASGNGDQVPDDVVAVWGQRLYGCTNCQDACPYNKKPIEGIDTERGKLPDYFSSEWILNAGDEEIRSVVKGSALGMQWLGPASLRRNAELALRRR